ncbi:transposable element Tcb2 transposase [Trichonephila clavipes]|nr:transposable element Tcb2 transposase [Trichonephila clavipes]
MAFTLRQGPGRSRQTSRREVRYIVRNARVRPTASSATIQAQVAPSLETPVSSQTIRRFNLSSDNNRVRGRRPRGERLNPAFSLKQQPETAGVMEWGDIVNNKRSPLVLIRSTMSAQQYVHGIL